MCGVGMCNYYSYNQDSIDKKENMDLDKILWNPFTKKEVSVDYCIAEVIKAIWDSGIDTGGCCCGHNMENPSVILRGQELVGRGEDGALDEVGRVQEIIDRLDGREWDILSWRLTKINDYN